MRRPRRIGSRVLFSPSFQGLYHPRLVCLGYLFNDLALVWSLVGTAVCPRDRFWFRFLVSSDAPACPGPCKGNYEAFAFCICLARWEALRDAISNSTHVLRLHCNPDVDLGVATLFDKRAHNHIIYSSRTVPLCRLGWLSHCGCCGYNLGARFRTEWHEVNAPVQNALGIAREQIDHAAIQCGCSTDALVPAILWDTVSSALENGRVVNRVSVGGGGAIVVGLGS